jgi:hypothetical protein
VTVPQHERKRGQQQTEHEQRLTFDTPQVVEHALYLLIDAGN